MTPAELKEFHKEAIKKRNPGYIRISIGYKEFLLPYAAGIQILQAMEHAELLDAGYATQPYKVLPLHDEVKCHPISEETYTAMKLSHFMGISFDDALAALTKRHT